MQTSDFGHDSVEDAVAALNVRVSPRTARFHCCQLYKLYCEYQAEPGRLQQCIQVLSRVTAAAHASQHIYETGRQCNFRVPTDK